MSRQSQGVVCRRRGLQAVWLCGALQERLPRETEHRAGDSRALDPRAERRPRGRRGRASAAENAAQATQSCHFLKASCLPSSCAALPHSTVVTTERSQRTKQSAEELLVFGLPSFLRFASQARLALTEKLRTGTQQVAILLKELWVFFKGSSWILAWFYLLLLEIVNLFLCMFQLEQSCGELTDQPCGLPSLGRNS